jgi:tRNA(Arg) A34 adenosine deaminase TadA
MDINNLPRTFGAQLPDWVFDAVSDDPAQLPVVEDRMRLVHRLAERNHRENTGGPFAAIVANSATGEILSVGVNLVLASGLSSAHAEVVALSLAQTRLGTWDLAATPHAPVELVVNWRPCVMCYGATMWAGIERLVIAGQGDVVEELTGFDEGPMREDWRAQFEARGITVVTNVLRDGAIEVFTNYSQRVDKVVYNGRNSTERDQP